MENYQEPNSYIIEVVIEADGDVYQAYCPSFPGCITWGHTRDEALKYIQEAVELYVEDLIEDGEPVPGVGIVERIGDIRPVVRLKEGESGE